MQACHEEVESVGVCQLYFKFEADRTDQWELECV